MSLRKGLLAASLGLAAGLGGYALYSHLDPPTANLETVRFTDLEGNTRTLAEHRGKLLLVNFWATWCGPCLTEIPLLIEAQKKYGSRGLQVLGPAMDRPEAVRAYNERMRLPYPVFVGDAEVAAAMTALGDTQGGLPFSVLISPTGEVLNRHVGDFTADELKELIETHLK